MVEAVARSLPLPVLRRPYSGSTEPGAVATGSEVATGVPDLGEREVGTEGFSRRAAGPRLRPNLASPIQNVGGVLIHRSSVSALPEFIHRCDWVLGKYKQSPGRSA